MKKRLLSLTLALVMALSMTLPALAAESDWSDDIRYYEDVPVNHWCYEEIMTLSVKGIVSGSGGKYRPGDTVTKAAALKMVINSLGIELQANPSGGGKWYNDYLYTAQQLGAVDEAFAASVEGAITRLGMAQLMANLSGLEASADAVSPFADCADGAVTMLYEKGIALGKVEADGKRYFNGGRTLSRGEMAVFCLRLLRTAQTQKARELAPYYNLPADISFTENPKTRDEFMDDVLIEYLCGNYMPTFFFDTPEQAVATCNSMHPHEEDDFRVMMESHTAVGAFFTNIIPWAQCNSAEKLVGVRFYYAPELDAATLYAQQMEALEFAKNLSQKLRDQGRIRNGMTQRQIVQVYYDWLNNYGIKKDSSDGRIGAHNVYYDSAYAVFIAKDAACVGRAAAFSLLMGIEGIPCRGLSGKLDGGGHVLNYVVADGTAYLVDWGNRLPIVPATTGSSRFIPKSSSLKYAQESLARFMTGNS